MLGRTPGHLQAVRPLVDGVISDFEATEEMLAYLINRAQGVQKKMLGPRAVIGVPSGITNVEIRAVRDAIAIPLIANGDCETVQDARAMLEASLSRSLKRKVTLEPYTDKALLGGAVLKLGDTASARAKLERATIAAPDSFEAWHALAEINFADRRFDAAGHGSKLGMTGRRDPKSDVATFGVRELDGHIEVLVPEPPR